MGESAVCPTTAQIRPGMLNVQDARRQKLYFIDIEKCKIYTYEPSSGVHGYQIFERRPTALALLEDDSGVRQSSCSSRASADGCVDSCWCPLTTDLDTCHSMLCLFLQQTRPLPTSL